jgi:hypothetical protein
MDDHRMHFGWQCPLRAEEQPLASSGERSDSLRFYSVGSTLPRKPIRSVTDMIQIDSIQAQAQISDLRG